MISLLLVLPEKWMAMSESSIAMAGDSGLTNYLTISKGRHNRLCDIRLLARRDGERRDKRIDKARRIANSGSIKG
jgi:hypothetical protein